MLTTASSVLAELPENVQRILGDFVAEAQRAFATNLRSVVLFGSAAEGRMRATSDVNLIVILSHFETSQADEIREPLRFAEAAVKLHVMFMLESEIVAAATAFAQKFADIGRRRLVLFGPDPFADIQIPRDAKVFRLKQVLLNAVLRLRESYVARGQRQEQLALVVAESAGPLRASAATLLELEGKEPEDSKKALEQVAREEGADHHAFSAALQALSAAREQGSLPANTADLALTHLLELARRMYVRAEKIR
jgi:predicted nucleotidyltransferase